MADTRMFFIFMLIFVFITFITNTIMGTSNGFSVDYSYIYQNGGDLTDNNVTLADLNYHPIYGQWTKDNTGLYPISLQNTNPPFLPENDIAECTLGNDIDLNSTLKNIYNFTFDNSGHNYVKCVLMQYKTITDADRVYYLTFKDNDVCIEQDVYQFGLLTSVNYTTLNYITYGQNDFNVVISYDYQPNHQTYITASINGNVVADDIYSTAAGTGVILRGAFVRTEIITNTVSTHMYYTASQVSSKPLDEVDGTAAQKGFINNLYLIATFQLSNSIFGIFAIPLSFIFDICIMFMIVAVIIRGA